MADEEVSDKKDGTARRVYNLPADLLVRLRAFQSSQNLASEAEAVRRLLDTALQMRDTVEDILKSLKEKFEDEKDLRVIASEVLTRHILVTQIAFEDDAVWFRVKGGQRGRLSSSGRRQFGRADYSDDDWENVVDIPPPRRSGGPSWEPPVDDLEAEVPF